MHVFAYAGGIKGFAVDKNLVKKLFKQTRTS